MTSFAGPPSCQVWTSCCPGQGFVDQPQLDSWAVPHKAQRAVSLLSYGTIFAKTALALPVLETILPITNVSRTLALPSHTSDIRVVTMSQFWLLHLFSPPLTGFYFWLPAPCTEKLLSDARCTWWHKPILVGQLYDAFRGLWRCQHCYTKHGNKTQGRHWHPWLADGTSAILPLGSSVKRR